MRIGGRNRNAARRPRRLGRNVVDRNTGASTWIHRYPLPELRRRGAGRHQSCPHRLRPSFQHQHIVLERRWLVVGQELVDRRALIEQRIPAAEPLGAEEHVLGRLGAAIVCAVELDQPGRIRRIVLDHGTRTVVQPLCNDRGLDAGDHIDRALDIRQGNGRADGLERLRSLLEQRASPIRRVEQGLSRLFEGQHRPLNHDT